MALRPYRLRVERRTVCFYLGATVGPPFCVDDPVYCCPDFFGGSFAGSGGPAPCVVRLKYAYPGLDYACVYCLTLTSSCGCLLTPVTITWNGHAWAGDGGLCDGRAVRWEVSEVGGALNTTQALMWCEDVGPDGGNSDATAPPGSGVIASGSFRTGPNNACCPGATIAWSVAPCTGSGGGGGGGGPTLVPSSCAACDNGLVPYQYRFTMSGVTNGGCTDCGNLNQTFTLTFTTGCGWSFQETVLCGVAAAFGLNYRDALTNYYGDGHAYFVLGLVVCEYKILASAWSCTGSNVLTLDTSHTGSGYCANLPSTITLDPV